MTEEGTPLLRDLLGQLQARRRESESDEILRANVAQRRLLEQTADWDSFVKQGDSVDSFTLPEVHGGRVDLDHLLTTGPVVLIFFRFESCPSCNISVAHYQEELYPELWGLRATLVAVSPQVPEKLKNMKDRFNISFPVASDVNNQVARRFGITYTTNAESQQLLREKGFDLGLELGTGCWELPMPTAVVIDQERVVRFADVRPDWFARTEASAILKAVRSLAAVSA